jgi:hypothetical protein
MWNYVLLQQMKMKKIKIEGAVGSQTQSDGKVVGKSGAAEDRKSVK